ncbi:5-methylphenazine-1-carboxylate 1-monooxygenase [Durusdinium trenchii]|uniref:5-methylphenazine-1-carboxylate 1-monooxygenase n=1 Tax=Durusdinium trenchii TaxID=1381693 RepID=A0ABP0K5Y7_9DINO
MIYEAVAMGAFAAKRRNFHQCSGVFTPEGFFIASETVGLKAGSAHPQLSAHRAKFHSTLVAECCRLDKVILNSRFVQLERHEDHVVLHFENSTTKKSMAPVTCHFVVGADGLKSRLRGALLGDGDPRYTGRMIYRGLCEVDDIHADGCTVSLCGDATGNFICYPISERLRQEKRFLCNWGLCVLREHPGGEENWTSEAGLEARRSELQNFGGNSFAGLTPLQMAERTEKIIGWSLFDRDPLKSFDFGNVTLLGDAAHPLLPYGSQGATQAPWSKWSKCHVNHAVKQATAHCFGPLALRCRQCRLSLLGNKEQVH